MNNYNKGILHPFPNQHAFLRVQSLRKIFKGEVVDISHDAYYKSRWYKPYTSDDLAYIEYLSDMLDKRISYTEYLSSNMYVDTANTIIVDSDYSTY